MNCLIQILLHNSNFSVWVLINIYYFWIISLLHSFSFAYTEPSIGLDILLILNLILTIIGIFSILQLEKTEKL